MKTFVAAFTRMIGRALYNALVAVLMVAFIGGGIAALANYTATQGTGLTFGSIVVSTVHYAQQLFCDPTAPSQCVAVSAGGAAKVDGSAVTQPVSGTVTANAGTNLNTSALATSANQTNKSQLTQLTDGTNAAAAYTGYGAAPTGNVPGANVFVTNATALGAAAIASSSPVTAATINVTPTDCSGTVTSGGTAQNAFSAQATLHGFTIVNIDTSAAEALWISFTTTAAANTAQSYMLNPASATASGGSFTTPLGFGVNTAPSVVGATTGHKYSCTRW